MASSIIKRQINSLAGVQLSGTKNSGSFIPYSTRVVNSMTTETSIGSGGTGHYYASCSLSAGVWLINAWAHWAAGGSIGYTRELRVTSSNSSVTWLKEWLCCEIGGTNGEDYENLCGSVVLSATTTVYACIRQWSGQSINIKGVGLRCTKVR